MSLDGKLLTLGGYAMVYDHILAQNANWDNQLAFLVLDFQEF